MAAGYAGRLADAYAQAGRLADAARFRTQARIVRAGEPLNRVVAVVEGARFELDEPFPVEGRIQFVFERNRPTLRPAEELAAQGEKEGGQNRHLEALGLFREAAAADPLAPHPRYLEGFTLLHLNRYAEAADSYRATEELAPGWFQCRADLWLAEQLAAGRFGHEAFVGLYLLEDGPMPPAEKVRLADQLLSRVPDLAPAHLLRGKNLARSGRAADAAAALRAGLACAAEPDVKTRLLVELGVLMDDIEERVSLLREAQRLNGNLIAAASATLALRAAGL